MAGGLAPHLAATPLCHDTVALSQGRLFAAAAHKVAGVCGTFGLTRGTVLARELEIMYSRQNGPDKELAATLASTTAELRTLIESRK